MAAVLVSVGETVRAERMRGAPLRDATEFDKKNRNDTTDGKNSMRLVTAGTPQARDRGKTAVEYDATAVQEKENPGKKRHGRLLATNRFRHIYTIVYATIMLSGTQ